MACRSPTFPTAGASLLPDTTRVYDKMRKAGIDGDKISIEFTSSYSFKSTPRSRRRPWENSVMPIVRRKLLADVFVGDVPTAPHDRLHA